VTGCSREKKRGHWGEEGEGGGVKGEGYKSNNVREGVEDFSWGGRKSKTDTGTRLTRKTPGKLPGKESRRGTERKKKRCTRPAKTRLKKKNSGVQRAKQNKTPQGGDKLKKKGPKKMVRKNTDNDGKQKRPRRLKRKNPAEKVGQEKGN